MQGLWRSVDDISCTTNKITLSHCKKTQKDPQNTVIDYIGRLQTRPLYLLIIVEEVLVEVC